jgi:hypothetical protein
LVSFRWENRDDWLPASVALNVDEAGFLEML